ncbi:hypothetical protein GcC1_082033 [Golovinomyces cichoracearum]|uniref:Uncharacterized protein n=1 Tax=Golovinomyces cichoracearum TaxID=62708 RepID=A0A420IJY2_9PEZI|nr:hypothetical protein GcC1_082033 [Golovinomyces cichoracearum]
MLLSMIYSETKRSSDLISKLNSRLARFESALSIQTVSMEQMCELMKVQNTIVSSQQNFSRSTSFNHEVVDANFTTLECCVRESSKARCKIPAVIFKDPIELPDLAKHRTAYDSILPLISSKDGNMSTTFPESRLHELSTPLTRPIMQCVARIVERIKHLDGILSAQQVDILKSLVIPVFSSKSELNWDPSHLHPREGNPMSFKIHAFTPIRKRSFIRDIISGQNVVQAYANQVNPKK